MIEVVGDVGLARLGGWLERWSQERAALQPPSQTPALVLYSDAGPGFRLPTLGPTAASILGPGEPMSSGYLPCLSTATAFFSFQGRNDAMRSQGSKLRTDTRTRLNKGSWETNTANSPGP